MTFWNATTPKLCPLAIHHSIHFMQTRVRGKFLVGFVMMCRAVQKDQGKKIENQSDCQNDQRLLRSMTMSRRVPRQVKCRTQEAGL